MVNLNLLASGKVLNIQVILYYTLYICCQTKHMCECGSSTVLINYANMRDVLKRFGDAAIRLFYLFNACAINLLNTVA